MIKRCEICGREFRAKRKTARFCSSTCRSRAARGSALFEGDEPSLTISLTTDEVAEIINRAHIAASDLSRASMLTPSPLCLKLQRVAKKFEETMRSEQL